jgi:hypothetical protein
MFIAALFAMAKIWHGSSLNECIKMKCTYKGGYYYSPIKNNEILLFMTIW